MRHKSFFKLFYLFAPLLFCAPAAAINYQLVADEVFYDEKTESFKAIGNVKISNEDKIIWADRASYEGDEEILRMTGNVIFQDIKKGTTLFTHKLLFNKRLERHEAKSVSLRFDDKKRLRADSISAENQENQTILKQMIYSPCRECVDEEGEAKQPLWQIRSKQTIMDSEKKTFNHRNLYLDINSKTILYLPKFRHVYDTNVGLSGALWPTYGTNEQLGFFYAQPFYWRYSNRKDLTLVPVYSNRDKNLLSGSYRTALSRGTISTHVTATGDSNQNNDKLIGDESFFTRVNFNNQLSPYSRVQGNFHYLYNPKFFQQYQQNTNFNQYGGVATSYQDNVKVEQFFGRDYLTFETRYQHRLDPDSMNDYYVFPVARMRYKGGLYPLATGYAQGYLAIEELQRTSYQQKGRKKSSGKLSYQKNIHLSRQLLETKIDVLGNQVEERAATQGNEQKYAYRGVSHYYARLSRTFDYFGQDYILGMTPELLSHGSSGNHYNENFINEDSNPYIPDVVTLLAFEPLGDGEDIIFAGRRKAAGVQFFYQQNNGLYSALSYARADVTHDDVLSAQSLNIYNGKTDHALNFSFDYGALGWQQDVILAREDRQTLLSSAVLSLNGQKLDSNVTYDRYSNLLPLSPQQRYARSISDNPSAEKITESAAIGLKFRASDIWNFSIETRYDVQKSDFVGDSNVVIERIGDCISFKLAYKYNEVTMQDNMSELQDTITFSVQLVN